MTRSFPEKEIGSDLGQVITCQVCLKKTRKLINIRLDLEKLRHPHIVCSFEVTIGGIFTQHIGSEG